MSVRLHLVRHCPHGDVGRVLSGRCAGSPLTDAGLAKAHRLAAELARSEQIAAIQSSSRLRAVQTAEAIADATGASVEIIGALDEIDFGDWTGRSFADLDGDPQWRAWNEIRASARPPGGESMAEAVTRAVAHIEALTRRDWAGAVVCVSHCDVIRGVIAHYLGLGLDNLLRFDVEPGSLSTLIVGAWGGRLVALNKEVA
ncbi:histidine phosphatase family protein [Sphingomonas sp.]|jgi:broad specificity phosphatase PhoE|uniref:histidine phosphatase family protein n=1 Tax=Sphingomonas sp. TaxID=28214 RepID=UPI002ED9547A